MSPLTRGFAELPKILSGSFVATFFLPALLFQLWMLALVYSGHALDLLTYLLGSDPTGPAAQFLDQQGRLGRRGRRSHRRHPGHAKPPDHSVPGGLRQA